LPKSLLPEGFEANLVTATLDRILGLSKRFGADVFDTAYVGGGTPTMLSLEALGHLLGGIAEIAKARGGRLPFEWTVEANPDSLEPGSLEIMAKYGVTRISLGVQSLDPEELELLGRRHGPDQALRAVAMAAGSDFDVSADLISGIPRRKSPGAKSRQSGALARYAKELRDAGASHLSVYDLTIEEDTPLAQMEELEYPTEDESCDEREELEASLLSFGMRRYEVSNYALPGRECAHNLAYWRMNSYIGAGPGAVSTIALLNGRSLRLEEPKDASGYGSTRVVRAEETEIGFRDSVFETIMMAFRTSFGLDLAAFKRRFAMDAEALIGESLEAWKPHIVALESGPSLDSKGLDLLNRFLGSCLDELYRKLDNR
jgi:oxygen-independent coproporphyrinogen III oxidase